MRYNLPDTEDYGQDHSRTVGGRKSYAGSGSTVRGFRFGAQVNLFELEP